MDREAENSTRVSIYGEELGIRSSASPEYTRRVAAFVDKVMKQVAKATKLTDVHRIAILAAMSITDEYFQAVSKGNESSEGWEERVETMIQKLRKVGEEADEAGD